MSLFRTASLAASLAASLVALASPAYADDRADMETFMAGYLDLWNAHDAAAITARIYRLDAAHAWSTADGLRAEFDRLKSQGYDRSDTHSITGCTLSADTGQVELRYSRLKTDKSFMPPRDRTSVYRLRRFPDGWRVTSFTGLPEGARMDCPKR
jgi:hypothetical protein